MTISDELRISPQNNFDWGQKEESYKIYLQWTNGVLGVLISISLLLVGHLVKTNSKWSWKGLILASFLSTGKHWGLSSGPET